MGRTRQHDYRPTYLTRQATAIVTRTRSLAEVSSCPVSAALSADQTAVMLPDYGLSTRIHEQSKCTLWTDRPSKRSENLRSEIDSIVMCIIKVHSERIDPRNGVFHSVSGVNPFTFTLLMYSRQFDTKRVVCLTMWLGHALRQTSREWELPYGDGPINSSRSGMSRSVQVCPMSAANRFNRDRPNTAEQTKALTLGRQSGSPLDVDFGEEIGEVWCSIGSSCKG